MNGFKRQFHAIFSHPLILIQLLSFATPYGIKHPSDEVLMKETCMTNIIPLSAQDLYIHLLKNTKTYLCYALRIAGNIARAYTFKVNNKNTDVLNLVRDHPFSTYAKCSEKIFLTPRYVSYLCVSGG